jgi:kynurenine 3-monooxygenase
LSEATLHIGETERGAWEEKKYEIVLVLMVLFLEYATANAKSMFNYSQEF